MPINRKKLLEILSDRFGDDPKAVKSIHEYIAKDYEKRLSDAERAHKDEIASMRRDHMAELSRRDKEAEKRHREALKAIADAKSQAVEIARTHIRETTEETSAKTAKAIERMEKRIGKKYDTRIDDQSRKIERFTDFAVGAPNRSLYLNGEILSGLYSDVNFIPGSGITMSEADDETTHMANFTIAASGGGSGINPQTPTGAVNASNVNFTATGQVSIAVVDSVIDTGAILTYNSGSNTTSITTSVPPVNNIYAF